MEQLSAILLGSTEYFNSQRVHSSNTAWLAAVSQDLLGHPFSQQDQSVLLLLLQNFTPRDKVAAITLGGTEFESDLVSTYYTRYLHRTADASGVAGWVDAVLHHGLRQEDVIAQIIGSGEYFSHL